MSVSDILELLLRTSSTCYNRVLNAKTPTCMKGYAVLMQEFLIDMMEMETVQKAVQIESQSQ